MERTSLTLVLSALSLAHITDFQILATSIHNKCKGSTKRTTIAAQGKVDCTNNQFFHHSFSNCKLFLQLYIQNFRKVESKSKKNENKIEHLCFLQLNVFFYA